MADAARAGKLYFFAVVMIRAWSGRSGPLTFMKKYFAQITKKRLLWIFSLLFIAVIFWSSLSLQDLFFSSLEFFKNYIEENKILGIIVFFLLASLSAMLSPFSSVPLIPVALVAWGEFLTLVLLLGGWLLGETVAYFIGQYAGRPVLKYFIALEKIEYYKGLVSQKSQFILVLLFRLAMPAEIPGYVLGAVKYDFWKYLLATFIAELPFAIITVYSGKAFVGGNKLLFIGLIAILIAIIVSAAYVFRKKIK